jgi:hypothetical protein
MVRGNVCTIWPSLPCDLTSSLPLGRLVLLNCNSYPFCNGIKQVCKRIKQEANI